MGWRAVAAGIALFGCRADTSDAGSSEDATGTSTSGSSSSSSESTDGSTTGGSGTTTGESSSESSTSSTGAPSCPPEPHASSLWIANAGDGTVSKIATDTMIEEARYLTRADADGDPSHASVGLDGDAAVANRNGGVVVFADELDGCPDASATSGGPDDVRPFPDGCVRWERAFDWARQHPVAWTPARWDEDACRWVDADVWTSGTDGASIEVVLLDGATGTIEQTVPIDGVAPGMDGLFAAAVDANGDFWGAQLGGGSLVHVTRDDFEVRTHPLPITAYGVVVDHEGFVWTCWQDAARFDPVRETWELFENVGGAGGCNEDRYGVLWFANDPLVGLGIATGTILQTIDLPGYVRTVSVDADNRVWGIEVLTDPGRAFRIDPASGEIDTFTGLALPDAHGDCTGSALQIAGARRRSG